MVFSKLNTAITLLLICLSPAAHASLTKLDSRGLDVSNPTLLKQIVHENQSVLLKDPSNSNARSLRSSAVTAEDFRKLMKNDMKDRDLQDSCSCTLNDNIFSGSCGGLAEKKDNSWCETEIGMVCCGEDETDCCELSGGGIALLAIGTPLLIAAIVLCSCACCSCCPCYSRLCCSPRRNTEAPAHYGSGQPVVAHAVPATAVGEDPK
jgi:hypothetical protein